MRAIKLIKNGEEHYIDSFSQENVNSMIERYTRDNPEVKFFPMPRSAEQLYVGDSLEEIWNSYSNKNVVILREYDADEGWFYDNLRYVTGIGGYDEYIMAEHDGVTKKFYLRGEGNNYYECVRIETRKQNCHEELIATVTQDQNDGTMVVCNEGNPQDGTVVHITCSDYWDNTLGSVSFDNGATPYPLIYPSGDPVLGHEFSMRGDNYFFTFTGLMLNGKVYVWDFYSTVNAE